MGSPVNPAVRSPEWDDAIREKIQRYVRYILENLSDLANLNAYADHLQLIIHRRDEQTNRFIKGLLLKQIDELYGNESIFQEPPSSMLLCVSVHLHDHSADYFTKIIDDTKSSERRFNAVVNALNFCLMGELSGMPETYETIKRHLFKAMNEAEQTKDEEAYKRLYTIYGMFRA